MEDASLSTLGMLGLKFINFIANDNPKDYCINRGLATINGSSSTVVASPGIKSNLSFAPIEMSCESVSFPSLGMYTFNFVPIVFRIVSSVS